MMFKKIFCPVDLTENSVKALQWTQFLARKYGWEVVVLHVIESLQANPAVDLDYPQIQSAAVTALREFIAPLKVRHESMLSSGQPAHKIVSLADTVGADFIVMGTQGLRGVSHAFLGSTTEQVVRTSRLPVLTVTPECSNPPDAQDPIRILVPIPALQHPPRGYLKLRKILKGFRAAPTLMHVVRGTDSLQAFDIRNPVVSFEYTEMKQSLLRSAARMTNYTTEVSGSIRFGQVADEILKELRTGWYSYLLMSVRKKGILPAFVESTAYRILSLAPVPVITLKKGD